MLRHACGYALANKGHDTRALQAYLGYRNIQHTVVYTELSPTQFKNFWRELRTHQFSASPAFQSSATGAEWRFGAFRGGC